MANTPKQALPVIPVGQRVKLQLLPSPENEFNGFVKFEISVSGTYVIATDAYVLNLMSLANSFGVLAPQKCNLKFFNSAFKLESQALPGFFSFLEFR